tara:strand:- start:3782 stop:4048 length:267 start_codon:yes stop_codon:yes gene_type:complete
MTGARPSVSTLEQLRREAIQAERHATVLERDAQDAAAAAARHRAAAEQAWATLSRLQRREQRAKPRMMALAKECGLLITEPTNATLAE